MLFSWGNGEEHIIPLPTDLTSESGPLTVAIRVWHWPHWAMSAADGPQAAVRIGDAKLLEEWRILHSMTELLGLRQNDQLGFAAAAHAVDCP